MIRASPPTNSETALLAERFASEGFPSGFGMGSFRTYAVIQVWTQATEQAGTFESGAVAEALRTLQFETVLGRLGFDPKGDVTGHNTYVWYVWRGGEFIPLEETPPRD